MIPLGVSGNTSRIAALIASSLIATLMVVGTWVVSIYFSRVGAASLPGVTGGVVVGLTWLYYLAQIVIAGAELLRTLEERASVQMQPE